MKKMLVLLSVLAMVFLTGCGPSFFGGFSGIVAPNTSNKIFYEERLSDHEVRVRYKGALDNFEMFGRDCSKRADVSLKTCTGIIEHSIKWEEEMKRRGLL